MEEKVKKYLDKVLSFIIKDTKVYIKDNLVMADIPFFLNDISFINFRYVDALFYDEFDHMCKNSYGLTKEETTYLLINYLKYLEKTIKNLDKKNIDLWEKYAYSKLFSDWANIYLKNNEI